MEAERIERSRVMTANGILEGEIDATGIRSFKGIPFAVPPLGDLRWQPPQPPTNWTGVRPAHRFGSMGMQLPLFGDMGFRASGMSEDCLYLNVWTPAASDQEKLPVLIYFYGGGNVAGDGSEPRYDGASQARRGIVTLTTNYRLNVFGFMGHPELTLESPHHASGNYAYLDQMAALEWIHTNIAAFGGDPERITIAGESAGSSSVSAQMASPLSRHLFAGAIGSSGSLVGSRLPMTQAEAEGIGLEIAARVGANSLAELRAVPAERLLEATRSPGLPRFTATIDGYFLPKYPADIFVDGEQARVPLLLGWNSEEMNSRRLLGEDAATPENFKNALERLYGERAAEAFKLYPASTDEEALQSATDLAGDSFTGYGTWRWSELHLQTGQQPVYRYLYTHPRPAMKPEMGDAVAGLAGGIVKGAEAAAQRTPPPRGAVHSADIEYAMGNLATNLVYEWTPDDYRLSELFQAYYANFVKTANPNGEGLPEWPAANDRRPVPVMLLDVEPQVVPEQHRERYLFLDRYYQKK